MNLKTEWYYTVVYRHAVDHWLRISASLGLEHQGEFRWVDWWTVSSENVYQISSDHNIDKK